MARGKKEKRTNGGANLGFEQTLWLAADKLRGQESNPTTWKLANSQRPRGHGRQMNRGIEADLGDELRQAEGSRAANADSFHRDLHKPSASGAECARRRRCLRQTPRRRCARRVNKVRQHLKADYILANPPFNMSDWGGDRLRDDSRWKYGAPPVGKGPLTPSGLTLIATSG
jgi:type I restriction enzyme M protein